MKRKLTDIELKTSLQNIESREEELEYMEKVLIPRKEFAISVADIEFNRQLNSIKTDLKQLKQATEMSRKIVEATKDQVKNGVEIIEKEDKKNE